MKRTGLIRKTDSSVLSTPWNLNIGPISDGNKGFGSSTNIGKKSNDDFYAKKYMFSIENLAWKSSDIQGYTYNDLPYCERGSNGGRIMWFPPYDLKFSEQNSAKWDVNNFIGRPEPIYTYQNTTRSGSISFKIVVDHPSILNLLVREHFKDMSDEESTNYINAFFAGCEDVDFYDLITRYSTLDVNDLNLVTSFLNNGKDISKIDEKKLKPQPIVEIVNPASTTLNNSEEKIDYKVSLNFDDNYPLINSDEITSSSTYTDLYSNFINKKDNYKTRLNTNLNNLKNSNYNTEKLFIFNNANPSNDDITNQVTKLDTYFVNLTNNFNQYNSKLLALKLDLKENKVDNINIVINSSTSASGSEKYNNKLSLRRNYAIISDILNKISNNKTPSIKWKKQNEINLNQNIEFLLTFNLKDFGYDDNNGVLNIKIVSVGETRKECLNKDFKNITDLNITSPICFSCRESNLIIKYNKKLINSTNPNISPISNIDSSVQNNPNNINNTNTNPTTNNKPPLDIMKKIIMKTLTESFYFKKIEESTPLFFNSLNKSGIGSIKRDFHLYMSKKPLVSSKLIPSIAPTWITETSLKF
jgi:outer membrane protein OmpA-like peptidoglycan-associated protein